MADGAALEALSEKILEEKNVLLRRALWIK